MEPSPDNVSALTLEFEALAHADRTKISWERLQHAAVELVRVQITGPERMLDEVVDVPGRRWRAFVDQLLRSLLPEWSTPMLTDEPTQPEIPVPAALTDIPSDIGGYLPDAPTAPNRRADPVSFMCCTVIVTFDDVRRTSQLTGEAAMALYSRVYGYARDQGLTLPH